MTRKSVLPCLALFAVLPLYADDKGDVVYGRFGESDYIRECSFGMTTSERIAGTKRCRK